MMRVAVIGERGRMGVMLKERLTRAGCAVTGADQPLGPEVLHQACADADVVILCVPAGVMDEVACLTALHLKQGAVLADIGSVKMLPVRAMEKHYSGPVVGTHPLFGPHPGPEEKSVCVTPGRDTGTADEVESAARKVEELFRAIGCETFRSTPEEHDRAMAGIQGLNFITSTAYFAMLSRHPEVLPFVTPSFRRRLEAGRTMLTDDAELFTGMVATNPMSQDVVREYRSYLNVAAGGDMDMLVSLAACWFEK